MIIWWKCQLVNLIRTNRPISGPALKKHWDGRSRNNSFFRICIVHLLGFPYSLSSECLNYKTLNEADRKVTYVTSGTVKCDRQVGPGWFRFQGAAGNKMAPSCPTINRCGTHATGWLNGGHPSTADGQASRKVCFHWSENCCNWSTNIKVTNCGSYYVYYLHRTPACNLRYCGTE